VRRLERAVTQRNAVGQPVLVEPDPEVVALQGQVGEMDRRVQDLEASLQRIDPRSASRRPSSWTRPARDNAALRSRLNASDARIKAIEDQARAAAAAAAEAEQAGRSPTGERRGRPGRRDAP
jgi:hypothetical protein